MYIENIYYYLLLLLLLLFKIYFITKHTAARKKILIRFRSIKLKFYIGYLLKVSGLHCITINSTIRQEVFVD
jgi:hypothetical protein